MNLELKCLDFLSPEERELFLSKTSLVSYKNKDIIFKQNTHTSQFMIVKSGLIKIFKENRGERNFIFKLALENEFIGLSSLLGSDLHYYSSSSIGDCSIYCIEKEFIKELILKNGKFANYFLIELSKESNFFNERLLSQITKQLPGRIADVLLYFSTDVFKSTSFELPLTRKELAELAGTTKESFIRTLTEFKNDKIIDIDDNVLSIRSMDIIKTLHLLG